MPEYLEGHVVPRFIGDVNAEWLSAALSRRCPGTVVSSAERVSSTSGSAAKLFLRVTYRTPVDLPSRLVVKGGFAVDESDRSAIVWEEMARRLNAAEARFYRDFAEASGIEVPSCYYAAVGEDGGRSAVILEDLTAEGARFGSFDAPLDRDGAATVLADLARLHARFWDNPVLAAPKMKDPLVEDHGLLYHYITRENWDHQMARPRARAVPSALQDHDAVVAGLTSMWKRQFEGPLTAVHGDPHIGNLYVRSDGRTGLLDWQVFSRGPWFVDVPYFIVGALDVPTRRSAEQELLREYLSRLAAHGGPRLPFDECWLAYRQRLLHGFLNFLTPVDGIQSEEYNATVGGRFATAIVDHDSLASLAT